MDFGSLDILIQRIYYNPNSRFIYMGLLGVTMFLILVTLYKGLTVEENPLFELSECLINLIILVDFIFRMRLQGVTRLVQMSFYNILDGIVVLSCVVLFILLILS